MVELKYIPNGSIHTYISADLPAGVRASIQLSTSPLVLAVQASDVDSYLSSRFDKPARLNGAEVRSLEHGGSHWYLKNELDALSETDIEFVYEPEIRITADLPESVKSRLLGIDDPIYDSEEASIEDQSQLQDSYGVNTIIESSSKEDYQDEEEITDGSLQESIAGLDFEISTPLPSRIPKLSLEELAVNYHETGDNQYATEIYHRLSPLMYSIAWKYFKSEEDVADLVADKFAQFFLPEGLGKFVNHHKKKGEGNLTAYLGISVRNAALNIIRDRKRRASLLEQNLSKENFILKTSLVGEIHENQLKQGFREAIFELKPHHRDVILLRSQGLSYQEISESLGIILGTVMSRLSRAKAILRDKYPGLNQFFD